MAIAFRCPACGHKLRAEDDMVGKEARCQCGVVVSIPTASSLPPTGDTDDLSSSTWALKVSTPEDAVEPISAWTPLMEYLREKPIQDTPTAASRWRAALIGLAGLLALILVIGLASLFARILAVQQKLANLVDRQMELDRQITEKTEAPKKGDTAKIVAAKPAPVVQQPPKVKLPDPPPKVAKEKSPVAEPALPRGLALAEPPAEADQFHAKAKPRESIVSVKDALDNVEIREWHVAGSFAVEEAGGKTRQLSLSKEADKLGIVLVAVKVRLPAEALVGREFAVLNPDARLIAPDGKPYHAIGIRVADNVWFAPEEGKRAYSIDKSIPAAAPITQDWLFIAPIRDLNAGRMRFQFKDQPPVPLKKK